MALAVLVAPLGPAELARRSAQRRSPLSAKRRSPSGRSLLPLAVLLLGAACVVVLGPTRGVIAAVAVCPLGWVGLRALLRRDARRSVTGADPAVPLVLDLAAAALRSGRTPSDALDAAAPAAPPGVASAFARVAGLLRLGAEPSRAWQVLVDDEALAPVAAVAVRSAGSGARLAVAFERLAVELRDEAGARSAAKAQRVGVLALAPLAACFLPSFVLLGVVPVVVGIGRSVLAGLP